MARLNSVGDIQTEFLIRNNRTTTDAFLTDQTLNNWLDESHVWASGRYKWPFTEGRVSTTYTSGQEEWPYPTNWKPDSIRLLQIGTKRYQKLNWEDYQIYREEGSIGVGTLQDRKYSDFGLTIFINPATLDGGTLFMWGQFQPVLDASDKTALTVFSNVAEEGNEAIVEKMTSLLLKREQQPTSFYRGRYISASSFHEQMAGEILDGVWKRYKDEQYAYQSTDRGMWQRFNVLKGAYRGEINVEDRFY